MKIPNIKNIPTTSLLIKPKSKFFVSKISFKGDDFSYNDENNFDKNVLVSRGIIAKNKNLFEFFDEISSQIFKNDDKNNLYSFTSFLKGGYITLSTSCYNDLKSPYSAKAIEFDPKKTSTRNCALLEEEIRSNRGVGINFSEFKNPVEQIKKINSYFKFREKNLQRPPAGIALLNVNHPEILDFITLKDNEDFKNWCFDLSVVIPKDFLYKVDNDEDIILTDGNTIKAKKIYNTLINSMLKTGEPGVIFSDDKNYICDCCACAKLAPNEGLTLAHINLSKFYNNSKFDFNLLSKASDILSKAMKKIDSNGYIGILGYQDLLNKMNLDYGTKDANNVLENSLKTIKEQASKYNIKMAISPTGGICRLLKTTPSIEPDKSHNIDYYKEIDTLKIAQKYMEGNISKTILLDSKSSSKDIDNILRYCAKNEIKGITVYKP